MPTPCRWRQRAAREGRPANFYGSGVCVDVLCPSTHRHAREPIVLEQEVPVVLFEQFCDVEAGQLHSPGSLWLCQEVHPVAFGAVLDWMHANATYWTRGIFPATQATAFAWPVRELDPGLLGMLRVQQAADELRIKNTYRACLYTLRNSFVRLVRVHVALPPIYVVWFLLTYFTWEDPASEGSYYGLWLRSRAELIEREGAPEPVPTDPYWQPLGVLPNPIPAQIQWIRWEMRQSPSQWPRISEHASPDVMLHRGREGAAFAYARHPTWLSINQTMGVRAATTTRRVND